MGFRTVRQTWRKPKRPAPRAAYPQDSRACYHTTKMVDSRQLQASLPLVAIFNASTWAGAVPARGIFATFLVNMHVHAHTAIAHECYMSIVHSQHFASNLFPAPSSSYVLPPTFHTSLHTSAGAVMCGACWFPAWL